MADIKSDYLSHAEGLRSFYKYPLHHTDYAAIIRDKAQESLDREALADELLRQNRILRNAATSLANIEALRDAQTFTVTTGHQLVMVGGPLYTLYKIAHTIRLAEAIQAKHPEYKIVPIFWMATEDHDWEEINHFRTGFGEKHVYPGEFRGPVGRHTLESSIEATLPVELPAMLRDIFTPGRNYADAFRALIHALFGHTGLVILDADTPALKRMFLPDLRRELAGQGMAAPIEATDAALAALGYKQQIFARPINLFYIGDGERHVIEADEDGYQLKDSAQRWNRADLEALLEAHPEHFSPNVAARPLYQERILPNLAYIGGWAEMSYWMQLKAGFEAAGVNFPLLVPRMSATLLTQAQAAELTALNFAPEDLDKPVHLLLKEFQSRRYDGAGLVEAVGKVHGAYDALAGYLEDVDPTLVIHIKALQARANKRLEQLDTKARKAIRNQHPVPYRQIQNLKAAVAPDNTQQQRSLNLTAFPSISPTDLAQFILDRCQPEQYSHLWITLP